MNVPLGDVQWLALLLHYAYLLAHSFVQIGVGLLASLFFALSFRGDV